MAEPGATPSHQLFAGFNAFFSSTWKKTRVEQVPYQILNWPANSKLAPLFHIPLPPWTTFFKSIFILCSDG